MSVRLSKDGKITEPDRAQEHKQQMELDKAEAIEHEVQRRMAEIQQKSREAMESAAEATKATTPVKPLTDAQIDGEAARQKLAIDGEESVRVRLPLISKSDPCVSVTINGARYTVQRGETVLLPKSVIEVLEHAGLL